MGVGAGVGAGHGGGTGAGGGGISTFGGGGAGAGARAGGAQETGTSRITLRATAHRTISFFIYLYPQGVASCLIVPSRNLVKATATADSSAC